MKEGDLAYVLLGGKNPLSKSRASPHLFSPNIRKILGQLLAVNLL